MPVDVRFFPCLTDNYGFLVRDIETGTVAAIDTPDAAEIDRALEREGWRLDLILNTHHHWDHTGGNLALKEKWGCRIIGPAQEADRIPGIDEKTSAPQTVNIGASVAKVIETPGHTLGHIVFYLEQDGVAFVGDTLFALGCGRLFEGSPGQMWRSLSKLAMLPDDTVIYFAHEYTEANARFALSLNEENSALRQRTNEIFERRQQGLPTVPSTIGEEKRTNPFMRANAETIKAALEMDNSSDAEAFAEIRQRKDSF